MRQKNDKEYTDAMMVAFDEAADGLEVWEFGGAQSEEEKQLYARAAADVAKRIRKMAERYFDKNFAGVK